MTNRFDSINKRANPLTSNKSPININNPQKTENPSKYLIDYKTNQNNFQNNTNQIFIKKPIFNNFTTINKKSVSSPKNILITKNININQFNYLSPEEEKQLMNEIIQKRNIIEQPSCNSQYFLPEKKSKKNKTLVIDLDETLIHSYFDMPSPRNPDISFDIFIDKKIHVNTLIRPYASEFLEKMSNFYEIVIFTASLSQYAMPIIDYIDKNQKCDFKLFREHCSCFNNGFIKELTKLKRDLKCLILLDNNPQSYYLNQENGFPISTWIDDVNDNDLFKISYYLEFLANKNITDVRPIIKDVIKNFEINYEKFDEIIENFNKKNHIKKTTNNVKDNKVNLLKSRNKFENGVDKRNKIINNTKNNDIKFKSYNNQMKNINNIKNTKLSENEKKRNKSSKRKNISSNATLKNKKKYPEKRNKNNIFIQNHATTVMNSNNITINNSQENIFPKSSLTKKNSTNNIITNPKSFFKNYLETRNNSIIGNKSHFCRNNNSRHPSHKLTETPSLISLKTDNTQKSIFQNINTINLSTKFNFKTNILKGNKSANINYLSKNNVITNNSFYNKPVNILFKQNIEKNYPSTLTSYRNRVIKKKNIKKNNKLNYFITSRNFNNEKIFDNKSVNIFHQLNRSKSSKRRLNLSLNKIYNTNNGYEKNNFLKDNFSMKIKSLVDVKKAKNSNNNRGSAKCLQRLDNFNKNNNFGKSISSYNSKKSMKVNVNERYLNIKEVMFNDKKYHRKCNDISESGKNFPTSK